MRIVIIGGGCAGVLQAIALLRSGRQDLDIDIVEPAAELGEGVAYATRDPLHLLNVPSERLGAHAAEADGFLEWIQQHRDDAATSGSFAPRMRYGAYLRDALESSARSAGLAAPTHIKARVVALTRTADAFDVQLDTGHVIAADAAVLAVGSPPPQLPTPLAPLADDPDVYVSPWVGGALDPTDGEVLLVGTGLTAIDAALTLCDVSSSVRITAISRRGLTPRAHLPAGAVATTSLPDPSVLRGQTTLEGLERELHRYLDDAVSRGGGWREAFDAIRPHTPTLWQQLPPAEQTRFLRDRVRDWDVRRHRMAPGVAARWQQLIADGRVRLHASGLAAVQRDGASLIADLAEPIDAATRHRFDRIIACTGPGADITQWRDPLIETLLTDGRVTADVHRMGISADDRGAVRDEQGVPDPALRVLGSLRRGELWESTAVAEIRAQAQRIADTLSGAEVLLHR